MKITSLSLAQRLSQDFDIELSDLELLGAKDAVHLKLMSETAGADYAGEHEWYSKQRAKSSTIESRHKYRGYKIMKNIIDDNEFSIVNLRKKYAATD